MSIYTSVLTGGSNSAPTTAADINAPITDFYTAGIVGSYILNTGSGGTGAYAVSAQSTPNMTVQVTQGVAYVTATPLSGTSQLIRCYMSAASNVTIPNNSSGSTRYTWIYINVDPTLSANPDINKVTVATLVTSTSTSSSTDNGTPPTYGLLLAVVTVANGAVSITNANITDSRVGVSNSAGVVYAATNRRNNTTNITEATAKIQTGWGYVVPGAASSGTATVTFPVAFTNAPIVLCTAGGDAASATTYGSGGANIKIFLTEAYSITATTFVVDVSSRDATNWAAGNTVFFQWMAIGI